MMVSVVDYNIKLFLVTFVIIGVMLSGSLLVSHTRDVAYWSLGFTLNASPAIIKSPAVLITISDLRGFQDLIKRFPDTPVYDYNYSFYLIPTPLTGYVFKPIFPIWSPAGPILNP